VALLTITHFTDPACPFAFSAEPVRRRLRWHYADQLAWEDRMVVLSLDPREPRRLAEGAPNLQRTHGMPIDPGPKAGPVQSRPACAAVVAARVHAGAAVAERLLRALRVRTMAGGELDDPALLDAAAADAGLAPETLRDWVATPEAEFALESDIAAARAPSPAALRQAHKLSGPPAQRRYSTPSYDIARADGTGAPVAIPGFNPVEVYESALHNLTAELERRGKPANVEEALDWAGETPLATAEVALLLEVDATAARANLARAGAQPIAAGADFYWRAP
jgi:predicted DsbA family dithiol-disulfide isomerase